jgi:hypothetical protein
VERSISDVEHLCHQLIDQLKTARFAVDEATDVVKNVHLATYVGYVLEEFNIIKHFLKENEINCENCIGLCTDGAQLTSERNARFRYW